MAGLSIVQTPAQVSAMESAVASTLKDLEMTLNKVICGENEKISSLKQHKERILKRLDDEKSFKERSQARKEELQAIWSDYLGVPEDCILEAARQSEKEAQIALDVAERSLEQAKQAKKHIISERSVRENELRQLREESELLSRELQELEERMNTDPVRLLTKAINVKIRPMENSHVTYIMENNEPRKVCISKESENNENKDTNGEALADDFWSKCSTLFV